MTHAIVLFGPTQALTPFARMTLDAYELDIGLLNLLSLLARVEADYANSYHQSEYARRNAVTFFGGSPHEGKNGTPHTIIVNGKPQNVGAITRAYNHYDSVSDRMDALHQLGWALRGVQLFPHISEIGFVGLLHMESRENLALFENVLGWLTHYLGNHPRKDEANPAMRLENDVTLLFAVGHGAQKGLLDKTAATAIGSRIQTFLSQHADKVVLMHAVIDHALRHGGDPDVFRRHSPNPDLPFLWEFFNHGDHFPVNVQDVPLYEAAMAYTSKLWEFVGDRHRGMEGILDSLHTRLQVYQRVLDNVETELAAGGLRPSSEREDQVEALTNKTEALGRLYSAFLGLAMLTGKRSLNQESLQHLSPQALQLLSDALFCLRDYARHPENLDGDVHALVYDWSVNVSTAAALLPPDMAQAHMKGENDENLFAPPCRALAQFIEERGRDFGRLLRPVEKLLQQYQGLGGTDIGLVER